MINYRNLLESLPTKAIVFAFGRFQPPTSGHALLIKAVQKLAAANKADHVIFASRTNDKKKNPLPVDRKIHYLKLMFPRINFVAANDEQRTFMEVAKALNAKYKSIIMVAGSDRVNEYTELLNKYNGKNYNFDSIKVISAGERDPDSDDVSGMSGTKMRNAAVEGNFDLFKKGLPSNLREIDGKLLMNEIRKGMGLEEVHESIKFDTDALREQYFNKKIFNVGDLVESDNTQYEIIARGSNYLTVVDKEGNMFKKWIQECQVSTSVNEDISQGYAPDQVTFKGYTTKNLHHSEDAVKSLNDTIKRYGKSDPVSVLNAIKSTDTYMKINDKTVQPSEKDLSTWKTAHAKAKDSLTRLGDFPHHQDYWKTHETELEFLHQAKSNKLMNEDLTQKTVKTTDKLKVARIIGSFLGLTDVESMSNPEQIVNTALRKIRSKTLNQESNEMLKRMLALASEVNIAYDTKLMPHTIKEGLEKACWKGYEAIGTKKKNGKTVPNCVPVKEEEELEEDLTTSEYKVKSWVGGDGKTHSRKIRPKRITFAASKNNAEPAQPQKKVDEAVEEYHDLSEDDLNDMANSVQDIEHVMDAYDDDEFAIVDEDGNKVEDIKENVEVINEVLSKMERMRAKIRFAQTSAKRERKMKIALHRHSDQGTINKRARRLAIVMIKKRVSKKDPSKMTVSEKERAERFVERNKMLINRLAMKLAPKIKKIEQNRLSHKAYTKS
ncbi:MAG: hypothetical protein EBU90_23840 [Proteobacteria bacterium]|nr:hypothetical protein [Pseudomonadota bacterium]